MDAEVCGLICPRHLYIEVGKADELFDIRYVKREYRKVEAIYKRLGIPDNLGYREFEGGHEFGKDARGIDFLCGKLKDTIVNMEL